MVGYEEAWKDYKRIRNQWFLVFVGYVPIVGIVAFVSIKLFNTFTPAFVTAFLWMALFVYTGARVQLWRCPRCGKWFSAKWWYNKGFLARRCVHCGLPKYQE
ncbi:MAG: hypothetical protein HYR57_09260 [Candidatus Koribacter versatilis]|nr:hypothetical protein [Candidatus Koribacter versatilis]